MRQDTKKKKMGPLSVSVGIIVILLLLLLFLVLYEGTGTVPTIEDSSGLILVFPNEDDPSNPTFKYYKGHNSFSTTSTSLNDFIQDLYKFINNDVPNDDNMKLIEFEHSQYISERYVFLFLEGVYDDINIVINYYTSFLGVDASKVILNNSSVNIPAYYADYKVGALDNFWRSLENMTLNLRDLKNDQKRSFQWAASQAAPLRNVVINSAEDEIWFFSLNHDPNPKSVYASGGYASNIKTTNSIILGGQQQFCFDNLDGTKELSEKGLASWNTVVSNSPTVKVTTSRSNNPDPPALPSTSLAIAVSTQRKTKPKPSLSIDADAITINVHGTAYTDVFVALPQKTSTSQINEALENNLAVLLTPGYYKLSEPIRVSKSNSVLFSMGMTTIENSHSNAALIVEDDLQGVVISGLFIQANDESTLLKGDATSLLQIGRTSSDKRASDFSVYLYDVFIRVGAANDGQGLGPLRSKNQGIQSMVDIFMNDVMIENMWLWRADHVAPGGTMIRNGLGPDMAYCENALRVQGSNLSIFGLACEHTLKDLVVWSGDYGMVSFYQCELPYDAPTDSNGLWNYSGFVLKGSNFLGYGMGVYSFFATKFNSKRNSTCKQGILMDGNVENSKITNAFTVFLDPEKGQGSISTVINDEACSVKQGLKSDINQPGVPIWANSSIPCIYESDCASPHPPEPTGSGLSPICEQAYRLVSGRSDFDEAGVGQLKAYTTKHPTNSCTNPNMDAFNPNPLPNFDGVTNTSDLGIMYGNVDGGKCCGWLPHFNWIVSTCQNDDNRGTGQFCGSLSATGPPSPMDESCIKSGVKINYVAAYQFDGTTWNLVEDSSCGRIDGTGVSTGFEEHKSDFDWVPGDWTTKFAPRATGLGKDGPRGLSAPGSMFVLSADNFYYGGFYMLPQTSINSEYHNYKHGDDVVSPCWVWELDPVEGTGGWGASPTHSTFTRNINDLYFTTTAQTSGNMPMAYTNEAIPDANGGKYQFPQYFDYAKFPQSQNPYSDGNINRFVWGGGVSSSKYFQQNYNQPYIFVVIIDAKGYWTYRFIPDSDGNIPWDGIRQHSASRTPGLSPTRAVQQDGTHTQVDGNVKEALMLSPAVASDYSCGQAIVRHANMDWAFDANLTGSLLWQNKGVENKSGSYNLWEYYKDTGQQRDTYSPEIMGVAPAPYTDNKCHDMKNFRSPNSCPCKN